jgi:membrane protein YdbS with pleckstrin-like domain
MAGPRKRNPLLPWLIGLPIVLVSVIAAGVWMYQSKCGAPVFVQFMVLVVIPVVYLTLAYLTFRSQE